MYDLLAVLPAVLYAARSQRVLGPPNAHLPADLPASVMCCALAAVARALVLVAKCLHTRHQLNAHVSAALLLLAAAARALVFVAKFFDGKVPAATAKGQEAVDALGAAVAAKVQEYIAAMEKVR